MEGQRVRHWCHNCAEVIDPVMPELKCPSCDGEFVEEMDSENFEPARNMRSDSSPSLLAPFLLGMLGGSSRRSRLRRAAMDDDDEDDDDDSDRELEAYIRRRRRRRSSTLVRLLQTLRDDIRELDDTDSDSDREQERRERERARERQREREREGQRDRGRERTESLIVINSNNEAIILQGTFGSDDNNQEESSNSSSAMSLADYYLGSSLDILLQRLAESDLNRSGTPPAKKEAVSALATVNIQEVLGCSVCLEDFEMGAEAKKMPCEHKFHSQCILPWLQLHSSCPICRFQLPTEETKNPCESGSSEVVNGDEDNAAASTSDHESRESTDRDGGNHSGQHIFSALSALFSHPSSSSSDENASHSS